jgi:hypothetical protein
MIRSAYTVIAGVPGVRDHLEDLGVNGKIVLKMDPEEIGCEGMGFDPTGSGWGPMAGSYEHTTGHSGFIKKANILTAERLLSSQGL